MTDTKPQVHDVVIIGAGPGGLAAGIYAARAGLSVLILEKGLPGGQILMTWKVDNYPGFPGGTGAELAAAMEQQARACGCAIVREEAVGLNLEGGAREVLTAAGTRAARGIIVATGCRPNALDVPGEREHVGRGVSYCATCDGAFFQGLPVAVVGGGDTAVEEADYLTRMTGHVTLIHRRDRLRATHRVQEEFLSRPNATVIWDTVVEEVLGDASGVTGLRLKNVKTWEERRLDVQGVFIFVGITPNTGFLKGKLELDEWGFVKTDPLGRTGVPGIWAVGDVRSKEMRQVTTAVAEGATAAWHLEKSLRSY